MGGKQKMQRRNNTPYSEIKIFHHQDILQSLLKGERCTPLYIRLKPTNKCNQDCYYCSYRNPCLDLSEYNMNDEIPYEIMMSLLEDMAAMKVKAVTLSGGGEPLLYPHIEKIIERLLEEKIDLSVITNGILLYGRKAELLSGAKWVRLSIDTVDANKYSKIRCVKKESFNVLCDNIRNFSKTKNQNCELGVNMVVTKENYMEVAEMAGLMKELGVNHVKYAPLLTNNTSDYHREIKEFVTKELNRVQSDLTDKKFRIVDLYTNETEVCKNICRPYHKCQVKEFECVIGADSKVYICHHKAYMKDGVVFDLRKGSFKEQWYSPKVTDMFCQFDAVERCKQYCVQDGKNQLINIFLNVDQNQINFV